MNEPRESAGERGFVIVGVVMFVLALTILGISLFSISSFESQFLNRSLANEQAFSGAASGMERARFRMVVSSTLDAAATVVGTDGVTYARAFQDGDSTGPIDPGGGNVEVRVIAGTGNNGHVLRAEFEPNLGQDFYRRLVSTSADIVIQNSEGTPATPRCGSVVFGGAVWQNSGSTSWAACASSPLPSVTVANPPIPVPPVAAYFSAHPTGVPVVATDVGGNDHYNLQGTPGTVTYYRGRNWTLPSTEPSHPDWDMYATNNTVLDVRGYAVWIIEGGLFSFAKVTVNGGSGDALILVVGQNSAPGTDAIQLQNAIKSLSVPVILVSNGKVTINTFNNDAPTETVNYLSIYSNGLEITGPNPSAPTFNQKLNLIHAPNSVHDQPGGLIQTLINAGALPAPPNGGVPMAMVPSTWRQASN